MCDAAVKKRIYKQWFCTLIMNNLVADLIAKICFQSTEYLNQGEVYLRTVNG